MFTVAGFSNVAENPQQIEAHTASRIFLYKFVGSSMSSTLCDKTIIPKTTRRLPVINVGLRGALRSKVCQMSVVRGKVPVRVRVLDTPISFRAIIYNVSPSATPRLNAANIRNHWFLVTSRRSASGAVSNGKAIKKMIDATIQRMAFITPGVT